MNNRNMTQFISVLLIIIILSFVLNTITSHFLIEHTLANQINFLILMVAAAFIYKKVGFSQNNRCMSLSWRIILCVAVFIVFDIVFYLSHKDFMLAMIISVILVLVTQYTLKKLGYIKPVCKINKNEEQKKSNS
jgi:hypothetical protein